MFFAHVGYSLHILNSLKKYNKNKRFAILNKKHDLSGDNVKYGCYRWRLWNFYGVPTPESSSVSGWNGETWRRGADFGLDSNM